MTSLYGVLGTLVLAFMVWAIVAGTMSEVNRQLVEITESVSTTVEIPGSPVGILGDSGEYGEGSE